MTNRYSAVFVGEAFEHKGQVWTRTTHNRARAMVEGKEVIKKFKKHEPIKLVEEREK
jgi:hypothetical protein